MDVPIRYTLAAICFGVAILGFILLPVGQALGRAPPI